MTRNCFPARTPHLLQWHFHYHCVSYVCSMREYEGNTHWVFLGGEKQGKFMEKREWTFRISYHHSGEQPERWPHFLGTSFCPEIKYDYVHLSVHLSLFFALNWPLSPPPRFPNTSAVLKFLEDNVGHAARWEAVLPKMALRMKRRHQTQFSSATYESARALEDC